MKYYTVCYKSVLSDEIKTIQIFAGDKQEAKNKAKSDLNNIPGLVITNIYNTKTGK